MSTSTLTFKQKLNIIIFEADTPAGKFFDVGLLIFIVISVVVVVLESVSSISAVYHNLFIILEWFFTIIFTIEYMLRLYCARHPIIYARSFFGIVDLLSIVPTYLSFFILGSHSLIVIRALRIMRVFRIFKLIGFLKEARFLVKALNDSKKKVFLFYLFIILLVTVLGSIMYLVEGHSDSGFTSIPQSMYWGIVTLTTVGYGDIAPVTPLGEFIAAFIMILGYAIIAVPTGIVSAEIVKGGHVSAEKEENIVCLGCGLDDHSDMAVFCNLCGEQLKT